MLSYLVFDPAQTRHSRFSSPPPRPPRPAHLSPARFDLKSRAATPLHASVTNASNCKAHEITHMQTAGGYSRIPPLIISSNGYQGVHRSSSAQTTIAALCPSTSPLLVSCHMAQPANPHLSPGPARPPAPV